MAEENKEKGEGQEGGEWDLPDIIGEVKWKPPEWIRKLPETASSINKAMSYVYGTVWTQGRIDRADAKGRAVISEELSKLAAQQIARGEDPGLAVRAYIRFQSEIVEKQRRRERVLSRAVAGYDEALKLLPSPGSEVNEKVVSDDFFAHFWEMVDKTSDEDLQEILAHLLERELSGPGRVSPATLFVLAGLSRELAKKFNKLCCMSLGLRSKVIIIQSVVDREDPTLKIHHIGTSTRIGDDFEDFGIEHLDLLEMRTAGLVASSTEEFYLELPNYCGMEDIDFAHRPADLSQTGELHEVAGTAKAIPLTQAGIELRAVMALEPHPEYTSKLLEILDQGGFLLSIEEPCNRRTD